VLIAVGLLVGWWLWQRRQEDRSYPADPW
jgi:predicted negative regulator of RcsB-dependent stress response